MRLNFLYFVSAIVSFCLTSQLVFSQYRPQESYASLYDSETAAAMRTHVREIASEKNAGRKPGSEGEKNAAEYLYNVLEAYGVEMLSPSSGDEFGIAQSETDTLVSRNVVGFVQGYDPKLRDRYILVGARIDNLGVNEMTVDGTTDRQIYYGANGNASGVAVMAELARMIATNSILFRRSVIFVGFGASTESFAGSWYFINRAFADAASVDLMINLDMLGTGNNGFYAYTSSNRDVNSVIASMEGQLQPVRPEVISSEPYPSDHRTFYSREIPSVFFTTGRYAQHNTPRDMEDILDYRMMERELEYIYNFTISVANTDEEIRFRPDEGVAPDRKRASQEVRDDLVSYFDCDYKPAFLNSTDPRQFLVKWVYPYLKYPHKAVEEGIQGTVMVGFVIDKEGKMTDVEIVKGVHPLLDEEALKVVSASPKWKPGRRSGQKVRTSMTIPVEFRLEKKSAKGRFGINGRRTR